GSKRSAPEGAEQEKQEERRPCGAPCRHRMTDITAVDQNSGPAAFAISEASVGDYIALMKPRVMSLVVFTALVGLMVTPRHLHPVLGFAALLCVAIGAGAAGGRPFWGASRWWCRRSHTT